MHLLPCPVQKCKQMSLFPKAYHPLAQQYFSAGLVWSLPWGGGRGGRGVLFHYHFQGGSSSATTSRGPLLLPLLGGPLLPPLPGGGSHVTYPIMLLYTAIEHPSASWAKFTSPPPPRVEQTDRQMCENITFPHTTYAGGNNQW